MKKIFFFFFTLLSVAICKGQSQIITTGNNTVNPLSAYQADIVIGSNVNGGTRHDASMMWWSNASASRISNTNDVFYYSVWNTATPNVGIGATVGALSYFMGNVGIGTSSPQNKLEVVGSSRLGGGVDYGVSTILSVAPGTIGFDAPGMPGARFYISGANGNVGIGTTNPDTKLAVAGTIHSQAVKVDMNGWSDYVFKPAYKLLSIETIKGFIDKNHHLPDMPLEKEVMKNGIDLGEMVKLQQKKIEELTLYMINQENRINKLEGVINKKRK